MNTNPRRKRGLLAGLVAAATALTIVFSAAPAQADGPVIDPAATGSIILHKFEQPVTVGDEGNGLPNPGATVGLTPLSGIVFSAQRVNGIDLTTNAGWEAAAALTVDAAAGDLAAATYRSNATDVDGLATIAALPVGLYYVKETTFPNNVTPVSPFLVTIPMTHPTELNTWIYDVHVYPKNATTEATKSVVDAGAVKIGDNAEWTILSDVPKSQIIDKYVIVDVLDPKLQFVSDVVSLTGASGVVLAPADYDVTTADNTLTVTFTPAGLLKLASAWRVDPAARVKVLVTTKVLEAGEITNAATIYPNIRSFGRTTTPVLTKWGTIVLEKANAKNTDAKLQGAEFQVFLTEEAAKAKTASAAISINGVSTFTSTGVDGRVVIEGLRYSGWADGKEVTTPEDGYRTYWISEIKAPVGFELLTQPIEVVVDNVSTTVVTKQVLNVPKNAGFQLPLTGASGATTLIMGAGLLLLVLGTTAVVVSRRKHRAQV
ncbi:SpaH/EbpB family LPXTG-anchored major pilin [Tessaracoccus antarcticus]|nr:SpaH/EbpB family LPXTG-anchored major pilin [Tessaracoccus antarcticus]